MILSLANFRGVLWALVMSGACVGGLFTLTGFLGGVWWIFDLTASFRVQYFVCLGFATILFLVGKKWTWAVVTGMFAIINLVEILPSFIGGRSPPASGRSLRVLLANVLCSNRQYEKVRRLISSEKPDIIVIAETTASWMKELSCFEGKYPHVVARPRGDAFGIVLFSRFPFLESEILDVGGSDFPTAVARLRVDDRELTVVATHPAPPMTSALYRRRNRQLDGVAEYVRSLKRPLILIGDLNTTPWSPVFKKLLRRTGLRDSRRGKGIQATWPVQLPPLRVPLDHLLHSPEIAILRRKVGPKIGSDHFPIIVDFALPER